MTEEGLSTEFAERVTELAQQPVPEKTAAVACMHLLNVIGTAIGAANHPAVQAVVDVGGQVGGQPVAPVLGRRERLDPLYAAMANGLAAHLDDYDDTHLETVIHPSAATLAAALGIAVDRGVSGRTFLTAFTLGCEVQLRAGRAISPAHYDEGWHITGTCGVLGAATAAAVILGLDPVQLNVSWGIAASETVGHREGFGSALKPFHVGKAAGNGLLAALLAQGGFTGSTRVFEAERGFMRVLAAEHDPAPLLDGLGSRWDLCDDVVKPYPCGIVIHPAIDAAIALSSSVPDPTRVLRIVVHCHPLVQELTGSRAPRDRLEAKFSAVHGVAAGLVDGRVGLAQYADARVADPLLAQLRSLTVLQVDDRMPRDAVRVEVERDDGERLSHQVAHARGSLARPMTNAEVEDKVRDLVQPTLPGRTEQIIRAVEDVEAAQDLRQLVEAVVS